MNRFIDIRIDEPLVPELIAKLSKIGIGRVYYTREDGYPLIKVYNEDLQEAVKRERQKEDSEVKRICKFIATGEAEKYEGIVRSE